MALTEQTVPVRLAGGVDTKSDPKTVPTSKLLVAENLVFAQGGSLAKRNGYDLLSKGVDGQVAPYGAPRALAARDDELLLFAGGRGYSRRPSSSSWSDVGPVASVTSTERPVVKTGTHQEDADCWASSGVVVSAWEDSRGGVWWAVLEEATDRVLRAAEQLDAQGAAPRVVAAGGRFHVYWLRLTAGEIYVAVMNPANYLSPPLVTLLTDGVDVTKPGYDVTATARPGTPAIMAWPTPTEGVRISYVDGSGVLGSPTTGHPTGVTMSIPGLDGAPVGVDWREGYVAVCAPVGGDLVVMTRQDIDLSIVVVDVVIPDMVDGEPLRCSCAFVDPPEGQLFSIWSAVECDAALPQDHQVTFARAMWDGDDPILDYAFPCGVNIDPRQLLGHGLLSRVHAVGADACVVVAHQVPFFPYAALVRLDDFLSFSVVGQLLVGTCSGLRRRRVVASVATATGDPGARLWGGCYREQTLAATEGNQFTETGVRLCRMDHADEDALQSARLGTDLVIAGSSPQRYDGGTVAELNFRTAPDGEIEVLQGTGGGLEDGATYAWQFCYEEVDAAGEIHQGPMSIPVVVTLLAGRNAVTFTGIPTYRLTSKRRVRIAVWRTEANDETSDPRYYRVTSLDPAATGANGFLLSTIGANTVPFTDLMSDETLVLREPAYTNAGVLSNDPAPVGALVASGKSRLFFSSAADPDQVFYTQQRRAGYGPELSVDLSTQLDPEGGPVTAVAVLDDMVVVFKRGQTYAFSGPGPLPNPDAAPQVGFGEPQLVTSDVGCVSPRSIAVTPIGIVFRSARGYHLLDRSRQVRYVGAAVERWNDLAVAGAVALPNRTSILILHVDGPALHYDYYFGEWSWFTNHEALDAVVAGDQYYFLRADADGQVAMENRSSYLDGNREVRFYLETAWVRFLPYVQGWQKLWHALVVGDYVSPHLLRFRVAVDYQKGWGAPYDIDPQVNRELADYGDGPYGDGPYGGDSDQLYQERVHVSEQCMAAKFSLEDLPYGEVPLGGSVVLTELLLTGGALRASERPRASRSH